MVRGSGHTSLAKRSLGRGERRRPNTGLMLCEGEARGVWLRDASAVTLSTPVPQLMSLDRTTQGQKATEPPHNLLSGSVDSIKQSDLFFKRVKSCRKISLTSGIHTFSKRAEPLTGHWCSRHRHVAWRRVAPGVVFFKSDRSITVPCNRTASRPNLHCK